MNTFEADVAVLLPGKNPNFEQVATRYEGLSSALADLSMTSMFVYGAGSYDAAEHGFNGGVYTVTHDVLGASGKATVVRDLTVQKTYDAPLFHDWNGPAVINDPIVSKLLARGVPLAENTTGLEQILPEQPAAALIRANSFRMIAIGGVTIGAVQYRPAEMAVETPVKRHDYLAFIGAHELPESMSLAMAAVQTEIYDKSESMATVIAVDVITGVDREGSIHNQMKVVDKPKRISTWDRQFSSNSHETVVTMAELWNRAEAALLARQVQES